MTQEQLKSVLHACLRTVAPEVDPETLDSEADLREEMDLDSMDFLKFVGALHKELGLEIPEQDYRLLASLSGAQDYLSRRLALS